MKDSGSASLADPDVPDEARPQLYTQSTSTLFRVADCLNILANRPLVEHSSMIMDYLYRSCRTENENN